MGISIVHLFDLVCHLAADEDEAVGRNVVVCDFNKDGIDGLQGDRRRKEVKHQREERKDRKEQWMTTATWACCIGCWAIGTVDSNYRL